MAKIEVNIMDHEWMVEGATPDEGWKIVTKDSYIGNEDDDYQKEWIATVYDEVVADYIVAMHQCGLAMLK